MGSIPLNHRAVVVEKGGLETEGVTLYASYDAVELLQRALGVIVGRKGAQTNPL